MSSIPPDSSASNYLLERGVQPDFAVLHGGAKWTKDELEIWQRLGLPQVPGSDDETLSKAIIRFCGKELLSFPLADGWQRYFSKLFPLDPGKKDKGFRASLGIKSPIYIPAETWEAKSDSSQPIFITEGPVKALALLQAGFLSIGLVGTWISEKQGWYRLLMRKLRAFEWRSREVFLVLDADQKNKTRVRQAAIRDTLLLLPLGAHVYRLKWDSSLGKGIDDYLVGKHATEELRKLIAEARKDDLVSEYSDLADLLLVKKEIHRTTRDEALFSLLTRRFAQKFKVSVKSFGQYRQNKKPAPEEAQTAIPEWKTDPLPWTEEPSPLETLLDSMEAEYLAFFDMTAEQADGCVLWVPTTYFMDVWQIHPYLGITAALKNSGKTTLLTFTSKFCYRPWLSSNITGATVYRIVHEYRPSMFVTEMADTFAQKPEVRTIFKAAYTRANADVPRLEKVGDKFIDVYYCAFCAKAFDLTGRISTFDDQIEERAIEIHMHKETREHRNFWEEVMSKNPTLFVPYQQQLFHFRKEHLETLKDHDAQLPKFKNSRLRENWRALFTIAGLAGSKWLEKAHAAAEAIQKGQLPELPEAEYLAIALHRLCRNHLELVERTARGTRFLPTKHILEGRESSGLGEWGPRIGLKSDKEAPWADRQPDGLTEHMLARLLGGFRVKSVQRRIPRLGNEPIRGYLMEELEEKVFPSITPK